LLYLRLSIFFVERPKALQVRLVNGAMLPLPALQFAVDLACERFYVATTNVEQWRLWSGIHHSGNQKLF
jgi:hypothetical protein